MRKTQKLQVEVCLSAERLQQQEVSGAAPATEGVEVGGGGENWKRMQVPTACVHVRMHVHVCRCKISHSCHIPSPAGVIGWEEKGTEEEGEGEPGCFWFQTMVTSERRGWRGVGAGM